MELWFASTEICVCVAGSSDPCPHMRLCAVLEIFGEQHT